MSCIVKGLSIKDLFDRYKASLEWIFQNSNRVVMLDQIVRKDSFQPKHDRNITDMTDGTIRFTIFIRGKITCVPFKDNGS
jgi:hypothetical protein